MCCINRTRTLMTLTSWSCHSIIMLIHYQMRTYSSIFQNAKLTLAYLIKHSRWTSEAQSAENFTTTAKRCVGLPCRGEAASKRNVQLLN